jgi:3-deoxy-manno-octulosonate cytidylyltransferase (CMP-KDO synthetase)
VLVATDDERIAAVVRGFGGEAVMTSREHATGTDRLAEVARGTDAELVVNVQGDEPLLEPEGIVRAIAVMEEDPTLPMATLSLPLRDAEEMLSPAVVKVVTDAKGDALYFSRSPIPHLRAAGADVRAAAEEVVGRGLARKHVGLYVYRRDALVRFASLPPSPLEEAEGLEQLRYRLARAPRDYTTRTNLAIALIEDGRDAEALGELDQALRVKPDWVPALNARGRALLAEGRVDPAIAAFERAIILSPTDAVARVGMARALLARGDREGAREQVTILRRLDPPLARQVEQEFR